jgi:hypothetical protein
MKTEKELLRSGNYIEALGDNYVHKSISVMIFKDKIYDREVTDKDGNLIFFYDRGEARDYVKKIELQKNEFFWFHDCNSDWL